jgi:hypothetical protein
MGGELLKESLALLHTAAVNVNIHLRKWSTCYLHSMFKFFTFDVSSLHSMFNYIKSDAIDLKPFVPSGPHYEYHQPLLDLTAHAVRSELSQH